MRLPLLEREASASAAPKPDKLQWLRLSLYWLCAFGFAGLRAFGDFSPFCAAFLAAVPYETGFGCFFAGAFGCFAVLPWQSALSHTAALFFVSLFRLVMERRFPSVKRTIVLPAVAFGCVAACGLAALAFGAISIPALLLTIAEGVTAAVSCALFLHLFKTPVQSVGLLNLSAQDSAVVGLCVCLLLLCASGFQLAALAPARIIACFLVLFAADFQGAKAGALAGVCVGAALSIAPDTRFLLAMYAVGGLVSGVFSPLGRYASTLFFVATAFVCAFVQGLNASALWCMVEIGIACAAYFLLPFRVLETAREFLSKNGLLPNEQMHFFVSANLLRASAQVGEVSQVISRVSSRLDNVINPELNVIFSRLQQNICMGCSFKTECWNRQYQATTADILAIAGMAEDEPVETALEKRCPRGKALHKQVEQSYTEFVSGMAAKEKVRELRALVTDQFDAVADFLQEVASQVRGSRVCDPVRSRTLKAALLDNDQYVDALHYFTNPSGRITVEITMLEDAFELDFKRIRKILTRVTNRKFEQEEIAIMDLRTTVTFQERAVFRVLFGRAQLSMEQGAACGDCVQTLTDPNGSRIAVISDGMGTGARAAVDSVLATTMMEKLLSCGFTFQGALKMVNCALMVKSTDESIATVDGVSINVYTGQADFYKAGAAVSFLRHDREITLIEEQSLPVGILRSVSFAHRCLQLDSGDIVLLVSDGVTAGDCGWINDELLAWSTNNMDDLASHIASLAKLRSDESTRDDITVVAAKVLLNG